MMPLFRDREEAGRKLAAQLEAYRGDPNAIVLALPRGGLPVAVEIGQHLHLPIDVLIVRKLGVPGHEELAMGAIARGGVRVLNDDIIRSLHIRPSIIDEVAEVEGRELERREKLYRGEHAAKPIVGRTIILVDDGLATGATMRAAVAAVRQLGAGRVVVAVPVGSWEACEGLMPLADQVVCLATPDPFIAIGPWYSAFPQVSDAEVRKLLTPKAAQLR